jgi:hypothetical protein
MSQKHQGPRQRFLVGDSVSTSVKKSGEPASGPHNSWQYRSTIQSALFHRSAAGPEAGSPFKRQILAAQREFERLTPAGQMS